MKKKHSIIYIYIAFFILTINKYQIVNAEMLSINFNELVENSVLTNQYLDKGITFKLLNTPDDYIKGPVIRPINASNYPSASGMGLSSHDSNFNNDFYFDIEILFSIPINYFAILSLDSDEPLTIRGFLKNAEISSKYYPWGSDLQVWNTQLGNVDSEQLFDKIIIDVVKGGITGAAGGPELFDNLKFNTVDICTEDNTGSLDIATTQGRYERNTSASIRIQNAPNKVNSLGFDIVFDSKSLTYTDFTKGALVQDFEYFDVNLIADGVLRCGGFDSDKPININDSGNVLCLEFNVLQKANSTKIELTDLEDDINTWTFSHGCFQPGCTGDVNKDGKITPQDALCAFDKYMGTCPTSCEIPCNEICGDVNYDNEVTPADALCIFNKYLEKPSCLDPVASSCEK